MKFLCLIFLIPVLGFSQTKVNSKVISVTLYKSGAQVLREVTIDLKAGENSFIIKGIAPELDKNSIQIKFEDASLTLNSLSHQLSLNGEDEYVQLNTKIIQKNSFILEEKKKLGIEQTLLQYQEKLLLNNQDVGGTYSGMKPEDLIKTVDYFEAKMKKVLNAQYLIKRRLDSLDFIIKENNRDLNDLSQKSENKLSEILFGIKTTQAKKQIKITISYFLQNAGWIPLYDFNAKSLSAPLTVLYKAKVFQYSGEDWKDIKLTLSNTLPKKNSSLPELRSWIWGLPNDYSQYFVNIVSPIQSAEVWGNVNDEEGENVPGVSVQIAGTSLGTATDMNGNYRLAIPVDRQKMKNELIFSFIGYNSQKVVPSSSPLNIKLISDNQALSEVVVTGYGVKKKSDLTGAVSVLRGLASGLNVNKNYNVSSLIEEKENPTSVEFILNETVSLLSDGKEKTLELKEIEIPVNYVYKASPKVDPVAFLTAQIVNWEQFNFLEGEVSLYFEGSYLGKNTLDLTNKDTLNLTLGRDENIKIERKQIKSFSKKQALGQNVNSKYLYNISIRNTKSQDINILIFDQFPITSNKEVNISDMEAPEAKIDKDSGLISWDLKVKKSSEKVLTLGFSVKYPKNLMGSEN